MQARSPLIWAAILLVILDVVVRAAAPILNTRVRGALAAYAATERAFITPLMTPPTIVFFGNSRTRTNVAPVTLAQDLGMASRGVVNLAIDGGRPSDALALYRAHQDLLGQSRVVVLAFDDFTFNASQAEPPDAAFRARATLADRFAFPDATQIPDLALGVVWRLWDQRETLHFAWNALLTQSPLGPDYFVDPIGRMMRVSESIETPDHDVAEARAFTRDYRFWPFELNAFEALVREAQAAGSRVVVIQLPFRSTYRSVIRNDLSDEHEAWLTAARERSGDTTWFDLEDPTVAGMSDRDFFDYGHLTQAGAVTFASTLAARLATQLALH